MKVTKLNSKTKRIFLGACIIMMAFILDSCSKKIVFLKSSVVPAAEGYVQIKKDNNNNYIIEVELIRLAEPERLTPSKKIYILWMVTEQGESKNMGQIKTSTGFLSNSLKSTFRSVSSSKPTKIYITAEDEENIQYPGSQVVLTTDKL